MRTYMALNSGSCKKRKMVDSKSFAPESLLQEVSDGGRVPQSGPVGAASAPASCPGAWEAAFSSSIAAAVASAAATAACAEAGARLEEEGGSCSCCSGLSGAGVAIWLRPCVRL